MLLAHSRHKKLLLLAFILLDTPHAFQNVAIPRPLALLQGDSRYSIKNQIPFSLARIPEARRATNS